MKKHLSTLNRHETPIIVICAALGAFLLDDSIESLGFSSGTNIVIAALIGGITGALNPLIFSFAWKSKN